jgi:deazaflavin-dependent oxidoreductase (nitroreductase family)
MAEESTGGDVQRVSNRLFLKIAGKRFRAYSILKHTGRRSGREYQNPVSAYPLGDGFVIPVLYGTGSQWVRNVMAAGGFTLRTRGQDVPLGRPEIIPPSRALAAYPPLLRWTMKARKIQNFVWAHRVAS